MNCERGLGRWPSVGLLRIRGELAMRRIFVPQTSHEGRTVKPDYRRMSRDVKRLLSKLAPLPYWSA